MKTYDHEQVAATLAPLKARLVDCAHGEGSSCDTLDRQLECCGRTCFDIVQAVRNWAAGVFSGDVIFDAGAETRWRSELAQLQADATQLWATGRRAEVPCYELAGQNLLGAALQELRWLSDNWVTPRPAVGLSARVRANPTAERREHVRAQLATLPPLAQAVGE